MAYKSKAEIKKVVEEAPITRQEPAREDGIIIWELDLTATENRSIGIEAKTEAEARTKLIEFLEKTELEIS